MITEAEFRLEFLHPKYWGYWLVGCFLKIASFLPIAWQMVLGKWMGRLYARFFPRRSQIARRNLELCFPELSEVERQRLLRLNIEESGRALFDIANAWYWSDQSVQKDMEILGAKYITEAKEEGCGIILFGVHSLALEMAGRTLGQLEPPICVYRPHNNPVFEYIQIKRRLRGAKALISKDKARQVIKALKVKESVWYAIDQAPARKDALFVPLFAVEHVATITATTRLAKNGNARLCPVFCERKENGGCRIEISAPLKNFPSGCVETDTRRLNSIIEQLILRRPEQYLWMHRRFKIQLDPGVDIYCL